MYSGISDLLNDIFGTHFTVSFPPTFGTLVAISFLLAAWTLKKEFLRKESLGLLHSFDRKVIIGEPISPGELISNGIFGFILGFKLLFVFLNSSEFFNDPQGTILSSKGNWLGGIACAGFFAFLKYREMEKHKLDKPKEVIEKVFPHQIVAEITMASAIGGLLGAKIFHILENWSDFIADPAGMFFSGSGLTMYGGLIVGAITVIWYCSTRGIPVLHLCDANATGLMLAYGTGRLGCQLAGDGDWGIVNNAPKPGWMSFLPDWTWSFRFPHNVISEGVPIPGCVGRHCYELAEGVFPTPLYESVACISLFFVLWFFRKRIKIAGMMTSIYLLLNGIERFLVERIRVNTQYHINDFSFTQAQLISLILIVVGLSGIIILKRKNAVK